MAGAGGGASSELTNVSEFRLRCKEASVHVENSLEQDKVQPNRWPYHRDNVQFEEEQGGASSMQQMRHIPFPLALVEMHQNRPIDHWRMGIFPDIYRVWIVLEHQLFIWNYMKEGGRDLVEVETPLRERIYGVGLAKAPPNVFGDNVRHVLVLVTPSYVLLHQVVFSTEDPQDEIRFVPTDYVARSDELCGVGVQPLRPLSVLISSTADGRIFLCGQDANVHEFEIHPKNTLAGWYTGGCKKRKHWSIDWKILIPTTLSRLFYEEVGILDIKVDDSRQRLYTLCENSKVTVYDIKHGRGSARRVVSSFPLLNDRDKRAGQKIVALCIVPAEKTSATDAARANAARGTRGSYARESPEFIACEQSGRLISWCVQGKRVRELCAIAKAANPGGGQNGNALHANMCYYSRDLVLMAHNGIEPVQSVNLQANSANRPIDDAVLHCVHATGYDTGSTVNNYGPKPPFVLSQHALKTSGGVQALAEVPMELIVPRPYRSLVSDELDLQLPELASQPTLSCMISDKDRDASRWVLILTKAGLHCFVKTRPIEQLSTILGLGNGSVQTLVRHPPIRDFSETEIYTMSLQLACGNGPAGTASSTQRVKERAGSIWKMGWDKDVWVGLRTDGFVPTATAGATAGTGPVWNGPSQSQWGSYGAVTRQVIDVTSRHTALALYLARLLRPIYKKTMKEIYMLGPYRLHILRHLKQKLANLASFLDGDPNMDQPHHQDPSRMVLPNLERRTKREEEKFEITKLYFLVKRAEEACERLQSEAHRYHSRIGNPLDSPDARQQVENDWNEWEQLTFDELVVEAKGQQLFFRVHKHLFLHELRDRDRQEVAEILQLQAPDTGPGGLGSTFWGTWAQKRLEAERHLQDARVLVDQGRKQQAREHIREAYRDLELLVKEDPTYDTEALYLHVGQLVNEKFEFFECYEFVAKLCLERIKILRCRQRDRYHQEHHQERVKLEEDLETCHKLLEHLVAFLYYEPHGDAHRADLFRRETTAETFWPSQGITKGLDLLPESFYIQHRDEVSKLRQNLNPGDIAEKCAKICRQQLLAIVFKYTPTDWFEPLHERLYMWYAPNLNAW
jgi:hypothetical protein